MEVISVYENGSRCIKARYLCHDTSKALRWVPETERIIPYHFVVKDVMRQVCLAQSRECGAPGRLHSLAPNPGIITVEKPSCL